MKKKQKKQAITLRQKGKSLNEIALALGVSKSTASVWCREVSLPKVAQTRLSTRTKQKSIEGLRRYVKSVQAKRLQTIEACAHEGANQLGSLTDRDVYCIGLGLYWGEGYKKGSQEFGFTNSDPKMITFYLRWLQIVFGVQKKDLILRVSINVLHKKRETEVITFWSDLSGVPITQFTKTSFIRTKSKKMYSNTNDHMGTLRIKVRRGTNLRREVLGAIASI